MKAITVVPGKPDQVQVSDQPDPQPDSGTLLVQGRLLGICGTDVDIVENGYGWPPPGRERLVIGHESLGAVLEAPDGSGFSVGDLVVGIVRRPDPVPCEPCSHEMPVRQRTQVCVSRGKPARAWLLHPSWGHGDEVAASLRVRSGRCPTPSRRSAACSSREAG